MNKVVKHVVLWIELSRNNFFEHKNPYSYLNNIKRLFSLN
ncbi:MAG: hypothetical protein ACD_46C00229G0001 [uncultured bacterium]|nr:MAG: hypothetical protein ACD_46C00229G0001 [uncultured bacterium]